jgi:lipopolysaccharide transport system ATP-binding protein
MSSNDIAVSVRGLSKAYTIAHNAENHTTLAEAMLHRFKNPVQKAEKETFWALKDIEFDIQKGDVVGIIGRNGAGKSTLLKVLSQITEPTQGEINLYGRVGSLLEVGTGFHPELTGRENIFLNGAILGMRKSEIQRQFDAIVDFAEVEKFLDTPVKRYSSGMYVRLAFAVAAHLNPEILIIDEVLAVGDANFQKKCLGKMQDVAQSGRTVLFVSHNMAAIRELCNAALLMERGQIRFHGSLEAVVAEYLSAGLNLNIREIKGKYDSRLVEVSLEDGRTGEKRSVLDFSEDYMLRLVIEVPETAPEFAIFIRVYDDLGTHVSSICSMEEGMPMFKGNGAMRISFSLPQLQLMPGKYRLSVAICNTSEDYLRAEDALHFEVQPSNIKGAPWAYQKMHGIVRISGSGNFSFENK